MEQASALYEALRGKADIEYFNRILGSHGAIVVSIGMQLNTTLLSLSLSCNAIGNAGVAAIAETLKVNSSLQKLVLCYNNIGASGAAAIAKALKVNSSLQKLDLSFNKIGDSGAASIAEALEVNLSLQELNLFHNNIGDSGATAIAKLLEVNSSLQRLDLRENNIGDAGVAAIEQSLERSFLRLELNLNVRFPNVLLTGKAQKLRFLYKLSEMEFRSFIMTEAPPTIWPHVLAKVSTYPSLVFHLLLQIPGSDLFSVKSTGKRLKIV
jgi:hypothetical protein